MTVPTADAIRVAPIGACLAASNPTVPTGTLVGLRCAPVTQGKFAATPTPDAGPHGIAIAEPMAAWKSTFEAATGLRISALVTHVRLRAAEPVALGPLVSDLCALLRTRFPDLIPETTSLSLHRRRTEPDRCSVTVRPTSNIERWRIEEEPETCALIDRIAEGWLAAADPVFGDAEVVDLRFPLRDVSGHARMAAARRLGL